MQLSMANLHQSIPIPPTPPSGVDIFHYLTAPSLPSHPFTHHHQRAVNIESQPLPAMCDFGDVLLPENLHTYFELSVQAWTLYKAP
jgi:hypothetical protein